MQKQSIFGDAKPREEVLAGTEHQSWVEVHTIVFQPLKSYGSSKKIEYIEDLNIGLLQYWNVRKLFFSSIVFFTYPLNDIVKIQLSPFPEGGGGGIGGKNHSAWNKTAVQSKKRFPLN